MNDRSMPEVPMETTYNAFLASLERDHEGDEGTYFLKPGYQSRTAPEYFVDDIDEAVYQPDVYGVAALAARQLNASCIIDVGCGRAAKLMAMAGEFDTIGIDFGPNLQYCQQQHPWDPLESTCRHASLSIL